MTDTAVREAETQRASISEQAYQHLRSLIIERSLEPGSVVTERKLADSLGASRTPLRAAIGRLEGEGLVSRLANGSIVIRQVSIDELLEILSVRRILESEAAALAAGRLTPAELEPLLALSHAFAADEAPDFNAFWRYDDAFHDLVGRGSGKPLLASLIGDLRRKARMCHLRRMPRNFNAQAAEHLSVLYALSERDGFGAKRAMARHLDQVRARLLQWLAQT